MSKESQKPWVPLFPEEIASVFAAATFPWWTAGGHSIEHFVDRPLRAHGDIDLLVLGKDHARVRSFLAHWDCWAADPPGTLRPWPSGEHLGAGVHDVWCRADADGPWRFQLMFDDGDNDTWRSRRCPLVCKPIAELGETRSSHPPFLTPEVQLFYKAKAPRPKDVLDFDASLPLLDDRQKSWLRSAIVTAYGSENQWVGQLTRL